MPQILIEIKKLYKQFNLSSSIWNSKTRVIPAVNNVDLQIYQGETLGLVGESGCGKSTLARLITLLEKPSSGSINFKGQNIFAYGKEEMKVYRRNVQLIFQDPYSSLNPRKSAAAVINEPLVIHRIGNKASRQQMVVELMAKVGLSEQQVDRYPHEFSGGQRQRIGIARALVLRPQLIIADEPVSALDVSIQAQILNLLKDLKRDFGLTYLFISHDLNVIRHMSDRIAVMYLGHIVELAQNNYIYDHPLHPYTRMLLSAIPSCVSTDRSKITSIKGEAAKESNKGCDFQARCFYKMGICSEETPVLKAVDNYGFCACHLAGKI
jgi:peptide/nickel transport system ATP-binding protein